MSFPLKMMSLLNEASQYSDIICWLPHGRGFTIHDKKLFETEVMPKYFQDAKYTSFTRRLRRWNFRIQTHGHKRSSYFHPMFVKGEEEMCREMKALPQVRKKRKGGAGPKSIQSPRDDDRNDQSHVHVSREGGDRSMKGPLKKRLNAIARPNDSISTAAVAAAHSQQDIRAVVSKNGSYDSASSVGESTESSSCSAAVECSRVAAEKMNRSPSSVTTMPPLSQPNHSSSFDHTQMQPQLQLQPQPQLNNMAVMGTSRDTSYAAAVPQTASCFPSFSGNQAPMSHQGPMGPSNVVVGGGGAISLAPGTMLGTCQPFYQQHQQQQPLPAPHHQPQPQHPQQLQQHIAQDPQPFVTSYYGNHTMGPPRMAAFNNMPSNSPVHSLPVGSHILSAAPSCSSHANLGLMEQYHRPMGFPGGAGGRPSTMYHHPQHPQGFQNHPIQHHPHSMMGTNFFPSYTTMM